MRDIAPEAMAAGYTGIFQIEKTIEAKDIEVWRERAGLMLNLRGQMQLKNGLDTSWYYLRDVLDDPPRVVLVRRDMDAIMDLAGISVGQLGG